MLDTAGVLTGICGGATTGASAIWDCFDLATGNPVATPWPIRVPNTVVNLVSFGNILKVGTKMYFAQFSGGVAT